MTSFIRSTRMPETEELAEGKPIFTTSQGLQLNLRINSTIDLIARQIENLDITIVAP